LTVPIYPIHAADGEFTELSPTVIDAPPLTISGTGRNGSLAELRISVPERSNITPSGYEVVETL
jgi:hypothetical protein